MWRMPSVSVSESTAAAADQLSANNLYSREIVSRIDTGANVFLYGLNLGLEAGW